MEIQQLRYFIALAKELNFQRAARLVGISQPTLSQQLKKLEIELGEALFERSPHHVKITKAGSRFIHYAMKALEALKQGKAEIQRSQGTLSGKISIAMIPTIGPYLLPKLLKSLAKLAPNLRLNLFEETTSALVDNLKIGKFDLGILALPIEDNAIVSKPLGSEEFLLAVANNHPLSKKKSINAKQLKSERILILQEGHCFRDQALDFCFHQHMDPQVVFEGSSLVSVMNLASADVGLTFVPAMAADKKTYPGLNYIRFRQPRPKRQIGAIWRMTSRPDYREQFIMEQIEKLLKQPDYLAK